MKEHKQSRLHHAGRENTDQHPLSQDEAEPYSSRKNEKLENLALGGPSTSSPQSSRMKVYSGQKKTIKNPQLDFQSNEELKTKKFKERGYGTEKR